MRIILLHKHLDRIPHPNLPQHLQLLRAQILLHQRPHPLLCELLRHRQVGFIDAEFGVVDDDLAFAVGSPRAGAVEDEDVAGVCDLPSEFLADADGVGHLGHASGVNLEVWTDY